MKKLRLENSYEKVWLQKKMVKIRLVDEKVKIFQLLQNCPKCFRGLNCFFANCSSLLESLDIMKHPVMFLVTTELSNLSFSSMSVTRNLSLLVA